MLNRERVKLADQHRGIKDMRRVPDVLVVVDANFETTAVKEATRLEIPVIAIVDSNTDPSLVSHVIPANDDSIRTIQLILSALTNTILSAQVKDVDNKNKDSDSSKSNDKSDLKESLDTKEESTLSEKKNDDNDNVDDNDSTEDKAESKK